MGRVCFYESGKQNPEAVFASAVMRKLRMLYGKRMWETAFRGGLGARSGIPDRLLCIDGRFVAIEFKNPDGKGRLGPKQKIELEALRTSGAIALVVSCAEDLDALFSAVPPCQKIIPKPDCPQKQGGSQPRNAS